MTMRVCALLIPRTITVLVAMQAVSQLRAQLTQQYPVMALPATDIELVEQILADLRQGQNHKAINKQYTPVGGSLTEEI
jgi:hypothetical protein